MAEQTNGTYPSESTPLVGSETASARVQWRRFSLLAGASAGTTAKHFMSAAAARSLVHQQPVAHELSPSEIKDLMETFVTEDKDEDKTWARLLVERYLEKQRWYFPGRDVKSGPSLAKAWAFYEHMTLPRYVWKTADHMFRLADPGESEKTSLYDPTSMPESCFVEFGIGVDQYFCSLRVLSSMLLICFFINIPNMLYYAEESYSGGKSHLPWALQASAICNRKHWVVCRDCTPEEWGWREIQSEYGTAPDGTVLIQRNDCGGSMIMDGAIDFVTFIFLSVCIIIFCVYLNARETRFDEDRLTADDYSLTVNNPPPDAKDPDEWRDFFNQFADKQVTMVTVALDNEEMLRKLVERRVQISKLKSLLPDYVDLDDEVMVRAALSNLQAERKDAKIGWFGRLIEAVLRSTGLLISVEQSREQLERLTKEIKELQKKEYKVSAVFVSFETEEGQRRALLELSPGSPVLNSLDKNPKQIPTFRGSTLIVKHAVEPSSVNWLNLSTPRRTTAMVMAINLTITIVAIAIAAYCENWARREVGPVYASPLVSAFNCAMPYLVESLMHFEPHRTEDSWQISYFTKITLFRWVNTAIIVKVFTPLTANLGEDPNDVLPSMYYILISELFVTPLLNMSDLSGNFQRHFTGPRALTQQEMNLNFVGTPYRLGERFTAMTNILFVCFFYSAMFPAVYLMGFSILAVQYFVDKWCILRIWKRAPALGSNLAQICRRYFLSAAIVVFICSSAFALAQFPYDNVCDKVGETANERISQTEFNDVRLLDGSFLNVTVSQDHPVFFCSQDLQEFDTSFAFPPTPRIQSRGYKWMTAEQEDVCEVFGWTALAAVVGFLAYFMKEIRAYLLSFYQTTYQPPEAKSQRIDFSCIRRMISYIPMIRGDALAYPLIACNVDGIDKALIGWHDPRNTYDKHNLIFDVPFEGLHRSKRRVHTGRSDSCCRDEVNRSLNRSRDLLPGFEESLDRAEAKLIFSIVKHYPPPWQRRERLEREMVGPTFSGSFNTGPESVATLQSLC